MSDYFSDQGNRPRARTEQIISPTVWGGVVATVAHHQSYSPSSTISLVSCPNQG